MTMRFREYDSTPPSAASSTDRAKIRKVCFECHLSREEALSAEGDSDDGVDSRNGKDNNAIHHETTTTFVWSAPKSQNNFTAAAKSQTDKLGQLCQDLFLPIGYPNSVADGYLEYQFYDSLQGLCSYLRGVVSTSAVLSATGVGDAEATAMSAAMTWAVRDGLGMIGGLLFSYVASPHFDAHVKEFRLLADVLNDIGLTLDMALPLVLTWVASLSSSSQSLFGPWFSILSSNLPSTYLVLTSTSMLCKVACGMAAGATKGNITDHFAISGNRADCQAKESTQETLVSLVGMCCGVWLAKVLHRLEKSDTHYAETCVNGDENDATCNNNSHQTMMNAQIISWSIFLFLTLVHVWANYVGMQMLRLRTLNRERANVALQPLVDMCGHWVFLSANLDFERNAPKKLVLYSARSRLLSPKAVSESLWKSMCSMVRPGNIKLGMCLKDLVKQTSSSKGWSSTLKWSQRHWSCEKYMIFMGHHGNKQGKGGNLGSITVMLRVGANDHDELKAFMHAHILNWCMHHEYDEATTHPDLFSRSYEIIQCLFQSNATKDSDPDQPCADGIDLYNVLGENGWDMTRLYLGFGPWRCDWEDKSD